MGLQNGTKISKKCTRNLEVKVKKKKKKKKIGYIVEKPKVQ